MAIIKPVILEGGQLKTAGVGDQVPQTFVAGLESSLESKASKTVLTTGLGLKVDKVVGKGLSELSFTTADKSNLDQAEQDRHTHANKSVIDDLSDNAGALEYRGLPVSDQAALDAKVDKVAGYSLVADDEIALDLRVSQDEVYTFEQEYSHTSQKTEGEYFVGGVQAVLNQFNSGSEVPRRNLNPARLATVLFNFGVHGSNYFPSKQAHNGGGTVVPLESINTLYPDSPIAPNPFIPHREMGQTMESFRFNSPTEAYAQLTGRITIGVRIASNSDKQQRESGLDYRRMPYLQLMLKTEEGTNTGSYYNSIGIGQSLNFRPTKTYKPCFYVTGMSEHLLINTVDKFNALRANDPSAFSAVEFVPAVKSGRIAPRSIKEVLDTSGELSSHRTTDWFDCSANSHVLVEAVSGAMSAFRVQFRDQFGRIQYGATTALGAPGADNDLGPQVIPIPSEAEECRVYFAAAEGPETAREVKITPLPLVYDYLGGTWADFSFDINAYVVFEPNKTYSFIVRDWNGYNSSISDTHFVVQSAALSCVINTNDMIGDWM